MSGLFLLLKLVFSESFTIFASDTNFSKSYFDGYAPALNRGFFMPKHKTRGYLKINIYL